MAIDWNPKPFPAQQCHSSTQSGYGGLRSRLPIITLDTCLSREGFGTERDGQQRQEDREKATLEASERLLSEQCPIAGHNCE